MEYESWRLVTKKSKSSNKLKQPEMGSWYSFNHHYKFLSYITMWRFSESNVQRNLLSDFTILVFCSWYSLMYYQPTEDLASHFWNILWWNVLVSCQIIVDKGNISVVCILKKGKNSVDIAAVFLFEVFCQDYLTSGNDLLWCNSRAVRLITKVCLTVCVKLQWWFSG